jgi:hypothetical protein
LVTAVVAGRTPGNVSTRRAGASFASSTSATGSVPLPRSDRVTPSGALPTTTLVRRLATAAVAGATSTAAVAGAATGAAAGADRVGSTRVCSPGGVASTTVTSRPSGDAFTL